MHSTDNSMIWRDTFFQDNFSIDKCLTHFIQKTDLETLKSDLKHYGIALHNQMSDILKSETEAIVNLAEYLTNLNGRIEELTLPVSQLCEEIKTIYHMVRNVRESYSEMLDNTIKLDTKRMHLNLKSNLIASCIHINRIMDENNEFTNTNLPILERAVNDYSFQNNYLEEMGLLENTEKSITTIGCRLSEIIGEVYLHALTTRNFPIVTDCLRMFENLGKRVEAEQIYRTQIVRPAMERILSESNLQKYHQDIDAIYNEVLDFLHNQMGPLIDIININAELGGYNFVMNSFWFEVDAQSRVGLPHLAAPGNPDLFQKRFVSTWNFLGTIAGKCGDPQLIQTDSSFLAHLKRFNLPVYFEIRFQQIACQFESDIIHKPIPDIYVENNNSIHCKLSITESLWKNINKCFDSNVFIGHLTDQFLKLSMLLLSRYLKWFELALKDFDVSTEGPTACENFIINSLIDFNIVKDLLDKTPTIIPDKFLIAIQVVSKSNAKAIDAVSDKLQKRLIDIKLEYSLKALQNVTAIPRLYRRTNRVAPNQASAYVIEAVKPITQFHHNFLNVMDKQLGTLLDIIIRNLSDNYLQLVQEVLRSVCKTEESLRRLKNRSVVLNEENPTQNSNTISDEMKIREQIKLDVNHFISKLEPFASSDTKMLMEKLGHECK